MIERAIDKSAKNSALVAYVRKSAATRYLGGPLANEVTCRLRNVRSECDRLCGG